MLVRSRVRKRKLNIKQALKKLEQIGKELSAIPLDKDPQKAKLELKLRGIAEVVKKEGIQ